MKNRPVDFSVWVPGRPRSKGNLAANFDGRGVHETTKGLREWTRAIQAAVLEHRCNPPAEGVFHVEAIFWFRGGVAGDYHTAVPDLDKLLRALFDALTGYIWRDDRMAASELAKKLYSGGSREGVRFSVLELSGQLDLGT